MMTDLKCRPRVTSNWLSRVTFWWAWDLFLTGYKRPLEPGDMHEILPNHKTSMLHEQLESQFQKNEASTGHFTGNLLLLILHQNMWIFLSTGISMAAASACMIGSPILLGILMDYFQDNSTMPSWVAYLSALGIVMLSMLYVPLNFHQFYIQNIIAMKTRASVTAAIYAKILRMSSHKMQKISSGKIINNMATDLEKIHKTLDFMHYIWVSPAYILVVSYLLWREVGWASLVGLTVMVSGVALSSILFREEGKRRGVIANCTDQRLLVMNEMIMGIRLIKMYCWEQPFSRVLSNIRRSEVKFIRTSLPFRAGGWTVSWSTGKLASLAIFLYIAVQGQAVTAAIVFKTITWVELAANAASFMPRLFGYLTELNMSLARVRDFLVRPEQAPRICTGHTSAQGSIVMEGLNATWGHQSDETAQERSWHLNNINVTVPQGRLIAVVGEVGSGKSSLLMALLGEMETTQDRLEINGSVAYAAQEPWVFSATVRNNILFGNDLDEERYTRVLQSCCFLEDLAQMPFGDQTMVGERGLMLSGGQKARLSLARATYMDADIYLLDDPLSAVDSKVANQLFERCITGILASKTRILVTHQHQFLEAVEEVLVMSKGKVVFKGSHDTLCNSDVAILTTKPEEPYDYKRVWQLEEDIQSVLLQSKATSDNIEEEEVQIGQVGWWVYYKYLQAAGRVALSFLVAILFSAAENAVDFSLGILGGSKKHWMRALLSFSLNVSMIRSSDSKQTIHHNVTEYTTHDTQTVFIAWYSAFALGFVLFLFGANIMIFTMTSNAGIKLHDSMFKRVVHARTQFFDANPVGRILNRFSRDMGFVDADIPDRLYIVVLVGFKIAGVVIITCVINPWVLAATIPLGICLFLFRQFAIPTTRHIKRLEAKARSPVYSHLSETFQGLTTIRAFGMQKQFMSKLYELQDDHTVGWYLFLVASRWLAIHFSVIIVAFIATIAFCAVPVKNSLSGGLVGLSLSYSLLILEAFEHFIRMTAELENMMTSTERILEYHNLAQEAALTSQNPPASNWPRRGSVTFQNVSLSYDNYTQRLKNISFHINGSERIGIIGRTGAGKTSLLTALFRLVEPSGTIIIDGREISQLGLHEFRSKISVIPQDPHLFSGLLRKNLDPFNVYTDKELWNAIGQVQLSRKVESMDGGLYAEVKEQGQNFSVGERQLLCLARAMLRQNKILMIDEATANVDHRTDELIQKAIRSQFTNCTVLTIAHRLHTVMDSDRILVLDLGQIKEYDRPWTLLQREDSHLSAFVRWTGSAHATSLKEIASKACTENIKTSAKYALDMQASTPVRSNDTTRHDHDKHSAFSQTTPKQKDMDMKFSYFVPVEIPEEGSKACFGIDNLDFTLL